MKAIFDILKFAKSQLNLKAKEIRLNANEKSLFLNMSSDYLDVDSVHKRKIEERLFKKVVSFFVLRGHRTHKKNQAVYNYTLMKYYAAHYLKGYSVHIPAARIASSAIKDCQNYGFLELGLSLSKLLFKHYSLLEANKNLSSKYLNLYDEFKREYDNEVLAEKYFSKISLHTKFKTSLDDATLEDLKLFNKDLADRHCEFPSITFYKAKYLLKHYESDYTGGSPSDKLAIANEAIDLFNTFKYHKESLLPTFEMVAVEAYLDMRDHKKALDVLENIQITSLGKSYATQYELKILCNMRLGRYDNALELVDHISKHSSIKISGADARDRFYLLKFYASLMTDKISHLRVKRVMNDLHRFQMDKKGMNINLIVGELCFLGIKGDFDTIRDMCEPINSYMSFHKVKDTRTKFFIRLLLLLPDASFDWHKFRKAMPRYLSRMAKAKDVTPYLESVLYEDLWEKITSSSLRLSRRYQVYLSEMAEKQNSHQEK